MSGMAAAELSVSFPGTYKTEGVMLSSRLTYVILGKGELVSPWTAFDKWSTSA